MSRSTQATQQLTLDSFDATPMRAADRLFKALNLFPKKPTRDQAWSTVTPDGEMSIFSVDKHLNFKNRIPNALLKLWGKNDKNSMPDGINLEKVRLYNKTDKWVFVDGKRYRNTSGNKTLAAAVKRAENKVLKEGVKDLKTNPGYFGERFSAYKTDLLEKFRRKTAENVQKVRERFVEMNAGETDRVIVRWDEMPLKDALMLGKNIVTARHLSLKFPFEEKYFALNDKTVDKLMRLLPENYFSGEGEIETGGSGEAGGSDQELQEEYGFSEEFEFHAKDFAKKKGGKRKIKSGGAFFKYLNKTHFDFSRYGVFKEINKEDYSDNCLYIALKHGGFEQLEDLKMALKNRDIPECKLKDIADRFGICIKLRKAERTTFYGDRKKPQYNIGLRDQHYYINERAQVTSFCLEHYQEVKDQKDCHMIYRKLEKRYMRSKDRFIDSHQLINILLENEDLVEPITYDEQVMSTQFYNKVKDVKVLTISEANCKESEKPKGHIDLEELAESPGEITKSERTVFVVDFETSTQGQHLPYMCHAYHNDKVQKMFYGDTCGRDAIDWICRKAWSIMPIKGKLLILAHNLSYDLRFLLEHIIVTGYLPKNGRCLQARGFRVVNGQQVDFTFHDTLSLIPKPLSEFGKCFGLEQGKEVMPYKLYTQENIHQRWCPIEDAVQILKDDGKTTSDIEHFLKTIEELNLVGGRWFDIIEYSAYYCRRDTEVTKKGYDVFRGWVLSGLGVDTDECLTTTSISKKVSRDTGCFEEVYQLGGSVRDYIQQCVVGGRVMTRENKMVHIKGKIADFDGVSLYPSSIARLPGFLKGKPKILENKSYQFLQGVDGYFIRIKITDLRKRRAFPLLSKINEKGSREFTNEMIGETVYIDKFGLEDAIEFHDISFEIVDGVYFDEGRNELPRKVIRQLFKLRAQHKRNKNPIQEVFKLIMNTFYGFTCQKAPEYDIKILTEDDFNTYLALNYNYIHSYTNIGGHKWCVKAYNPIDDHYNFVHVGVEVLSMSKRIMNEVMCTAEDHGIPIFYEDTDSTHMFSEDVPKLAEAFKAKYDRELIGKDLGQFHDDFDLPGTANDVHSTEFIGLGKKCYLDCLKGKDKDGNEVSGYHIRMKGVPTSCVQWTAKERNQSVRELYIDMFKHKTVAFDLTEDGAKAKFDCRSDFTVWTKQTGEFTRNLQFNTELPKITQA